MPLAYLGRKYFNKAHILGQTNASVNPIITTYQANRLRPFAPVHVKFSDSLNKLSWVRRTRINGEMQDYVDIPLMEESEQYLLEFLDEHNKVIHHLITNRAELDFTPLLKELNAFKISISQLANSVGAGKPVTFLMPKN